MTPQVCFTNRCVDAFWPMANSRPKRSHTWNDMKEEKKLLGSEELGENVKQRIIHWCSLKYGHEHIFFLRKNSTEFFLNDETAYSNRTTISPKDLCACNLQQTPKHKGNSERPKRLFKINKRKNNSLYERCSHLSERVRKKRAKRVKIGLSGWTACDTYRIQPMYILSGHIQVQTKR